VGNHEEENRAKSRRRVVGDWKDPVRALENLILAAFMAKSSTNNNNIISQQNQLTNEPPDRRRSFPDS